MDPLADVVVVSSTVNGMSVPDAKDGIAYQINRHRILFARWNGPKEFIVRYQGETNVGTLTCLGDVASLHVNAEADQPAEEPAPAKASAKAKAES